MKSTNNFVNKRKEFYSKKDKRLPDLILLGRKSNLSRSVRENMNNSTLKATTEHIVPINTPKSDKFCKNDTCQNLNINDSLLGIGYCSTKCAVEYSSLIFNEWLFSHTLQPKTSVDEKLCIARTGEFVTPKTKVESGECFLNPYKKDAKVDSPQFPEASKNSNLKTSQPLQQSNVEENKSKEMSMRPSLFNIMYDKYVSNPPELPKESKENTGVLTESNSSKNSKPKEKSSDSDELIFISYTKNRDPNLTIKKRRFIRTKQATTPKIRKKSISEEIHIVID